MIFVKDKANFPNSIQRLLLMAALRQGEPAIQAYESWRKSISLDDVDYGSQMLIPLLYHNFLSQGFPLEERDRLKGIFRYFWVQSQKIQNVCKPVLTELQKRNIPTLILKGVALALKFYPTFGVRSMGDLDLMVRKENVPEAMGIFRELGWRPLQYTQKIFIPDSHAVHYLSPGGEDLDLHWHLLHIRCLPQFEEKIWTRTTPIKIQGMEFLTLNDTDHLFHSLIHGFQWNTVAPVRWVADAHFILTKGKIQWERLLELAESFQVSLATYCSLKFLAQEMQMSIPQYVLDHLSKVPISRWEKREYKSLTKPGRKYGEVPALWHRYHGLISQSLIPKPLGFLNYLKDQYGFERRRTTLHFLYAKWLWRFRKKPDYEFPKPFPG